MGARLKFWRRSCVPKKGSRDEAVEIFPKKGSRDDYMTTAPPPNLTPLLHNTASYTGEYISSQLKFQSLYIIAILKL